MTHSFFPVHHFIAIMKDRVCLAFALITGVELNFGAVFMSAIRKARVHHGRKYAFGGLTTELCCHAGVSTEDLDYCQYIEAPPILSPT